MSVGLSRGQFVALAASAAGVAEFGSVASAQPSRESDHPRLDARRQMLKDFLVNLSSDRNISVF